MILLFFTETMQMPGGQLSNAVLFFSYFTVLSNVIIAAVAVTLAINPVRRGKVFSILKIDAFAKIIITGVVYNIVLLPANKLTGLPFAATVGMHMIVPTMALLGFLLFGPRSSRSRPPSGPNRSRDAQPQPCTQE